jgi:hypothetical protein
VTAHVDLPVATYDVRVVAAPATSCATPAVPDTKGLAVADGLTATVAAIGDLSLGGSDPAFRLAVFPDDTSVAKGDGALRFIHASPGTPAVDVGLLQSGSFTAVFSDVAFGATATAAPPIDGNGFFVGSPFADQTVAARVHGAASDALTVQGVSLPAGAIATAFAIGGKTGQSANPLTVLLCVDNGPASGLLFGQPDRPALPFPPAGPRGRGSPGRACAPVVAARPASSAPPGDLPWAEPR